MGQLLRQFEPDFSPQALGEPTLKALLSKFDDVGRVEVNPDRGGFTFVYHNTTHRRIPRDPHPVALHKEVWDALTEVPPPHLCVVDLAKESFFLIDPTPEALNARTSADPARYLTIPAIPQSELQALAVDYAGKSLGVPAEAWREVWEMPDWRREFERRMKLTSERHLWRRALRHHVVERFSVWCKAHGLKLKPFVQSRAAPPKSPESTTAAATSLAPSLSHPSPQHPPYADSPSAHPRNATDPRPELEPEALRALLLQAIEQMSLDELLALPIPARYLLRTRR